MKLRNAFKAAIVSLSFIAASAQAGPVAFTNPDFETGDLSGWSTIGSVVATASTSVTTFDSTVWSVLAEGNYMAQLQGNAVAVGTIESTLGIAAGTLTALNTNPDGGSLTYGSALYQDFTANAGDTIDFAWNYVATDYVPFNDPAFALLIGSGGTVVDVLASIHGSGVPVGTSGNSGWLNYSKTISTAGSYTLAFVTANDKDNVLQPYLHIDAGVGSCVPNCPPVPVPAPGGIVIVALGLLGLANSRRRMFF